MVGAVGAEMIDARGASSSSASVASSLVSSTRERIDFEATLVDGGQLIAMRRRSNRPVSGYRRAADGAADGIELEGQVLKTEFGVEAVGQLHDLQIGGGIFLAQKLDIELHVLAKAPGLRFLVAEERADGEQLDRLGPGVHAMFDVSRMTPAVNSGRRLMFVPSWSSKL